jgi:CRISPR-associated protein Cmr3
MPFKYIIKIKPLGLLYGSLGRFLSPENLVGKSGSNFPPNSPTLSGIFAHYYGKNSEELKELQIAGPFFSHDENPINFYVSTPLNCLVKDDEIKYIMYWINDQWKVKIDGEWQIPPNDKFATNTYLAINDWAKLTPNNSPNNSNLPKIKTQPWKFIPHLHPKLRQDERRVLQEENEGSLFLENAVQLDPDYSLIYLSNVNLEKGWYRFGGEGHLVEIDSDEIKENDKIYQLLNQRITNSFATITAGIWGSNRLSYRSPTEITTNGHKTREKLLWYDQEIAALLIGKATPFRYRLGNRKHSKNNTKNEGKNEAKRLSRGRYSVPSGAVYVLKEALNKTWQNWDTTWFPEEGYSFKRWGSGLSLPLENPDNQ